MHHCLEIYEILELICEAVLNQTQPNLVRPNLPGVLALLKTCRSFSVPATKLLWRDLPSIISLILIMPEDLVKVGDLGPSSTYGGVTRIVTFRRDIVASDWERFDAYALLVKRLGCRTIAQTSPFSPPYTLHDTICHELRKRDKILLPNLSTIEVESNDDLRVTPLLLASHVHCIKLMINAGDVLPISRLAINDIPVRAPSLKSLHLSQAIAWTLHTLAPYKPELSTLLDKLDLEEFHCDWAHLSDQMLEKLVRMRRLRKITIFKDMPGLIRVLHLSPSPIPQFEEVSLFTDSVNVGTSPLMRIVISLRSPMLELCYFHPIRQGTPGTPEDLRDLISVIESHCSQTFLTQINLDGRRDPSIGPSDSQLLRPLFAFSNLRQICLPTYNFDFTDAEVKELAMSWTHLEKLSFYTSVMLYPVVRTTLRSLLWFATYCKDLQSLSFAFNASDTDTFSEDELSMASGHKVSYLSVGPSVISNPDKVATFLNTIFPHISALFWASITGDDENSTMWEEVNARMPGLR